MLLLQSNAIADALNSSEWVFPIAECFHITAFAWSIGLIALVDFRLIGVGLKRETTLANRESDGALDAAGAGRGIALGPILFLSDPRMYLYNPAFRFKIGALVIAIIFNYTIHRKVALSDSSSAAVRVLVGVVSLALWISVVFGGLFIAFA